LQSRIAAPALLYHKPFNAVTAHWGLGGQGRN
jgi:hypothetical protein